jgi:para-aminobenzoate synthetase
MRLLLVDNLGSYTFNLYQLFAGLTAVAPTVVRNDTYDWDELSREDYDAIVISPGPGHPDRARDFGVCDAIIRNATVPVLGVCLGHQGIASAHGAVVEQASEPMHGRITAIRHNGDDLFVGIPRRFEATRYHSLAVKGPLPASLEAIAWAEDGSIMGLRERSRPVWGVQFHPESIGTPTGETLAANFLRAAAAAPIRATTQSIRSVARRSRVGERVTETPKLVVRQLPGLPDAEALFESLFRAAPHCFWLDSSVSDPGLARFSFLGTADGPCGQVVSFDVASGVTSVWRPADATPQFYAESIFDYIDAQLEQIVVSADLPFDLQAGFVGYFSYESKALCGGSRRHASLLPDAQFLLADRIVVLDHWDEVTYVVTLQPESSLADAESWQQAAAHAVRSAQRRPDRDDVPVRTAVGREDAVRFTLQRGRAGYEADIARCQELIREGESSEICLTNTLNTTRRADPYLTYRALRRLNPAPYAAFLQFETLTVVSSSPERFLKVTRDRVAEAKPIKGTRARAQDPRTDALLREQLRGSPKDRAENLMIVDLLRNDLGLVCDVGTVTVPDLMAVESYATVHQLVSTVRGRLRDDITLGQCVNACFPGGSMTGAPKTRTMEIIDEIEPGPRGVYSGALGFFGANNTLDLSIVIRTLVFHRDGVSVGAGGAITALSKPRDEFEEVILKATAPLQAIAEAVTGSRDRYVIADPDAPGNRGQSAQGESRRVGSASPSR